MISVSIVEDYPQYRQSLAKAISENSIFKLLGVYSSAEEAITFLPTRSPDILIVDIKLKSQSGIDLIARIKQTLLFTQVLICSSYQDDSYVFDAFKAGASGYILKSASLVEIQNAVIDLHNGGSPMSPVVARKVLGALYGKKKGTNGSMGLSEREIEVLSLLGKGHLYKEISYLLEISPNTVKNHCKNIYKRLHVQNKVEALNKFGGYKFSEQVLVN